MEFVAFLAPIAFVFALAAISQVSQLKKQVENLKVEIEDIKNRE